MTREQKWHDMYERYAEFLRKNGRMPSSIIAGEKELYVWLNYNKGQLKQGKMPELRKRSFEKILNGGDFYQFVVTDRETSVSTLRQVNRNIQSGKSAREVSDSAYSQLCQFYLTLCVILDRHPWEKYDIEKPLALWFVKNRESFIKEELGFEKQNLFENLWTKTSHYHNYNRMRRAEEVREEAEAEKSRQKKAIHKKEKTRKASNSSSTDSKQEKRWQDMCQMTLKFLQEKEVLPTQSTASKIYHWIYRQGKLLSNGHLAETRVKAFQEIIEKINDIRKRQKEKERQEREERLRKVQAQHKKSQRRSLTVGGKLITSKSTRQDDLWNAKWKAYMDYMAANQHRPSKHKAEDMVLFDWFKHSKKLLNQGKMRADRVEKFNQLLDEAKRLQRINNYRYADGELYTTEEQTPEEKANNLRKVVKVRKPREVRHEIKLYDYQADMKKRIDKAFKLYNSVMVQMPTGTGKTHVVASVVRDFVNNNTGIVWIVAHRRELVMQMKETLKTYLSRDERKKLLVTSIQWLSRHVGDMVEGPSLIVIDEAHHATAKTYANVMNRYPHALKLGVTATPYRLSGEGFISLFQKLLTSWDIRTFIQKQYLSPFEYYSISNNAIELLEIKSIKSRGADGDYLTSELESKFNAPKFIERLFKSYKKFADGKKGFVYAINIRHAESIALYYSEHGVDAAAVSSKTPKKEREGKINDFKTNKLTVLVSVDLFSEGYNSPDAEFVQLARPTLSLAKYLQMVGRGLRTAPGKNTCVILDNVGLAKVFGKPDVPHNWNRYFEGQWTEEKMDIAMDGPVDNKLGLHIGPDRDMYLSTSYLRIREHDKLARENRIYENDKGRKGLKDKDGKEILPCSYDKIEFREDGVIFLQSRRQGSQWLDLLNGVRYEVAPTTDYVGDIPIAIVGNHFYPRVRSKLIGHESYIPLEQMKSASGDGIDWTDKDAKGEKVHYYIPWNGLPKVYKIIRKEIYGTRLLEDENGGQFVQQNPDYPLQSVKSVGNVEEYFQKCRERFRESAERAKKNKPMVASIYKLKRQGYYVDLNGDDIYSVRYKNGQDPILWVDRYTGNVFRTEPYVIRHGKVTFLQVGDFIYIRNIDFSYPYQEWQVKSDGEKFWILNKNYKV